MCYISIKNKELVYISFFSLFSCFLFKSQEAPPSVCIKTMKDLDSWMSTEWVGRVVPARWCPGSVWTWTWCWCAPTGSWSLRWCDGESAGWVSAPGQWPWGGGWAPGLPAPGRGKRNAPKSRCVKKNVFVLLRIGAFSCNCSVRDMFGKHGRAFDVNVVPTSRCGEKIDYFCSDFLAVLTIICLQVQTV